MNRFKNNKISKSEFLKLNENNLMFITNPGRMGDEDGLTFIMKYDNELTIYRIDGLMYQKKDKKEDISLEDISNQFPKWFATWKHYDTKKYNEKYTYLYMGFGNGLSVDNSIYSEFEPYLNKLVKKYLENSNNDEKENLKYAAVYNAWKNAFINMTNDKGYVLKQ